MTGSILCFYAQKTLLYILLPPSSLLLLFLVGFILLRNKYKKASIVIIVFSLLSLYLLSIQLISMPLIRSLENDYPPLTNSNIRPDVVVVLTAGARDLSHKGLNPSPSSTSLSRLTHGVILRNMFRDVPLIICGGKGDPSNIELSEGEALGNVALQLGIPQDMLIIEENSFNTIGGAQQVMRILEGKGKTIILVTSAFHIGRAVNFYEMSGLNVIPAPTDYLGEAIKLNLYTFIPSSEYLGISTTAIYEYLCRLWYFLIL